MFMFVVHFDVIRVSLAGYLNEGQEYDGKMLFKRT